MTKVRCPNCGKEAKVKMIEIQSYQSEPHIALSYKCKHCGYIKAR